MYQWLRLLSPLSTRVEPHAPKFRTAQLGVWEVVYLPRGSEWPVQGSSCQWRLKLRIPTGADMPAYSTDGSYLMRFIGEIYELAPRQVIVYMASSFWNSLESSISLYLTSRLLDVVADRLQGKTDAEYSVIWAILAKVGCSVFSRAIDRLVRWDEEVLSDRIRFHFMLKTMRVMSDMDLITAEDPEVVSLLGSDNSFLYSNPAWDALASIADMAFSFTGMASQLLVALMLVKENVKTTGPMFIAMCAHLYVRCSKSVFAVYQVLTTGKLGNAAFVSYCTEPAYSRLNALHDLAFDERLRADRLNDGVGVYIEDEFEKQRNILGDKCTEDVYSQWRSRLSISSDVFRAVPNDLPMYIFALRILYGGNGAGISVASFTLLKRASEAVGSTLSTISYQMSEFWNSVRTIRDMYKLTEIQNLIKDGHETYPQKLENSTDENWTCGAQVEFQDVTFAYPGANKNALSDVSFLIKPGQLVVIVGVNGSGKSSLIKLFNRLYDPSAGRILLDGRPLADYKIADVRRSMAILRQEHTPYPLSLRENVLLGLPYSDRHTNTSEVENAVRQGGAMEFIQKLEHGIDTVLHPVKLSETNFPGPTIPELKTLVDGKERTTDISGGESQRLAASRTFMRLSGGNVRFLAADEPTSALDPEGEFELFQRLRQQRGGKTVVFITHRFGHLTRYADLILCLKDGLLIEQGTHVELLAKKGEYFRLHSIQAQAFLP